MVAMSTVEHGRRKLGGYRCRVASLALVSVVISCHAAVPAPEVRASPESVTGAAAAAVGDDGLFVLPSPVNEGYPQISAEQAQALAAAWVRRFAPMGGTQLEREHGRPLEFALLQECRLIFARSPYQHLPAEAPLALRNLVAGKFLVTFCSGGRPAVSVSIASSAVDLRIQGDHLVFPRMHGNEFVAYGIPDGFSGAPISPEHAANVAHSRTGRRVSEVPELWLRHAFTAPQNAVWRVLLESPVSFRTGPGLPLRETREVFVASGSGGTGELLRGLYAALGDAPESPPVLSARAAPGEPETIHLPLSYRPDAPQGFAPLTLTSRCLTDADTAAVHIRAVTQTVTRGDSASLVALGLPFRPREGVSLVSDPQVCDRVIDAYNSLFPNEEHPGRISSAYILKIGDSAYALALNQHGNVHAFLDASLRLLYVSGGL
jgi:hypothetical protein